MHQRRTGRIDTWLRNRRHQLPYLCVALGCSIVGLCLLLLTTDSNFSRMFPIALAFVALGATFYIAVEATAPQEPRGSDRPLPRLVAWGMLAPITAEGGAVWFGLHTIVDAAYTCMMIAFTLNLIEILGVWIAQAVQAPPTPPETTTAPTVDA